MTHEGVPDEVQAEVRATLAQIEREHGVRVLFACESGSRAWGFASPDSDFDVRFIYAHPRDWYLTIAPGRDVIELPISDELDVSGWDLPKALGLLRGGNATLAEWLDSPVVYTADDAFVSEVRELAASSYRRRRAFMHYVSLATKQFEHANRGKGIQIKKFLYALRTSLAAEWCATRTDPPPMRLADLADALVSDAKARARIDELVALKSQAGETSRHEVDAELTAWLAERARLLGDADVPASEPAPLEPFDALLRRWVG